MNIRKAKEIDLIRISEIEIFNYRYYFYPIFKNDDYYFNELQVTNQISKYNIDNIYVYDVMTRPTVWSGNDVYGTGRFGKFSATKWILLMKVTNTNIDDYSSTATMPTARQDAVTQSMSAFLIEKAEARTPVLDEDGTMMYFNKVTWQPFTTPEEYYGNNDWTPYSE